MTLATPILMSRKILQLDSLWNI